MSRPLDVFRLEADSKGAFDRFTSFSVTNDMTAPSEAASECGDDRTFPALEDFVALGSVYRAFLNNRLMLTGRVEVNDVPNDANGGSSVRFTVRTKLADAMFATARADARVHQVSLKEWILTLYKPLGYAEGDFVFRANVARDLITGKAAKNTSEKLVDPEAIKEDAAKVQPPEPIFQAVDRHLRRFGLMHWDAPDGKIVVGAPNDAQDPLYRFRLFRGPAGQQNNVLSLGHGINFSDVPSGVVVAGSGAKAAEGFIRARVIEQAIDADVTNAGFVRPVTILAEQVRTSSLARAAAQRELSARSMRKNTFDTVADGASHWDGTSLINYAPDTTAEVLCDTVGGAMGVYYLHRTQVSVDPTEGYKSQLTMVKRGIWKLS